MTDRAHVPFALVGLLVLVGSVAVVGSLQAPMPENPAVDREMALLEAETGTTLREASFSAAQEAAANPVTEPADTAFGSVIRENQDFEDAFRIRIFIMARAALENLETDQGDITVSASLPPTETPEELAAARDSVTVEPAGENGTKLAVTVDGIELVAERDNRTVARETLAPTVVLDTPVLGVAERVEAHEQALSADALESGLARDLTARLYPVAWARGYAQYGHTPIQNVVANRHVELLTNAAILERQRDAFGHSDPLGHETLGRASAEVAVTDVLSGANASAADHLSDLRDFTTSDEASTADDLLVPPDDAPEPADERTIGVNETATDQLLAFRDDAERAIRAQARVDDLIEPPEPAYDPVGLSETIQAVYSEDVSVSAEITHRGTRFEGSHSPGGTGWEQIWSDTIVTKSTTDRSGTPPTAPADWHRHASYSKEVVRVERTVRHWERDERRTETTRTQIDTYHVDLGLFGTYQNDPAPDGAIETVHEPGGPFDGPNLGDIPERAREQVIDGRGGPDRLAERAVAGRLDTEPETVEGSYPKEIREWVLADLLEQRDTLANRSIETTQGDVATMATNPDAELADEVEAVKPKVVGQPDSYESAAHRARVAARAVYVDRVHEHYAVRGDQHAATSDQLDGVLPAAGEQGLERLQVGIWEEVFEPAPPADDLDLRVETTPSYLPRESLEHTDVPGLEPGAETHSLVVRNVNLFSAPYRDVAETIVSRLTGPERIDLETAAQVLATTEELTAARDDLALDTAGPPTSADGTQPIEADGGILREELAGHMDEIEAAATAVLAERDLGSPDSREVVVAEALSSWEGEGERARALANGSGGAAIATAASERWEPELDATGAELLRMELESAVRQAVAEERPHSAPVASTHEHVEDTITEAATDTLADGLENATELGMERIDSPLLSKLPRGLPVLPPPATWYATVNYWHVDVRGEYHTFTVRAPTGTPDSPGAELVYTRDGSPVELDVTGDGSAERLGTATRVSFAAETHIVVGVPSGPPGVGDTDGNMVDESPGWPTPGTG